MGSEVMSTSCADVMITLCGVTLRALNLVTLRYEWLYGEGSN